MSIFAKTIFALFHILANFNDFHPCKTSVGKPHLPYRYLLLFSCPENAVWYFSEPILRRSKCYEAILILPKPRFLSFFAILTIFTSKKILQARHFLLDTFWFFFSLIKTIKFLQGSYHAAKAPRHSISNSQNLCTQGLLL